MGILMNSADCVIVGGGIGGAVLALLLGREGKHVVLLERELKPPATARPEILASATLEVFRELGVGEGILKEAAVPLQGLEAYQAEELLLGFNGRDFQEYQVQPYSTDPARTRDILLEGAASTHSVEVCRGVEVREILREGERIVGVKALRDGNPVSWKAPFVVGDDGGRSRVREALGISLKTRDFPFEFLGAAGPELPRGKSGMGQVWIEPRSLKKGIFGGVFMPIPQNRSAFVFLLSSSAREHFMQAKPSEFYEAAGNLSPRCEGMGKIYRFPEHFTVFKRPFGHASRYVADGAALLGDAAHPVTPVGGQGANMSVADAMALGETILEAFRKNDFSAAQLGRYEAERRPGNGRSIQFSVWADCVLRILMVFPWAASLLPLFLQRVNGDLNTKGRFIRSVSTTFRTRREEQQV